MDYRTTRQGTYPAVILALTIGLSAHNSNKTHHFRNPTRIFYRLNQNTENERSIRKFNQTDPKHSAPSRSTSDSGTSPQSDHTPPIDPDT